MAAQRAHAVNVGDIQNQALADAQRRGGGLRQEQRRLQVRADEIGPVDLGDVAQRRGIERRGVVHQNVEAAKGAHRHLGERRQLLHVEQIALGEQRGLGPRLVQLTRELRSRLGGAAKVDDDVGARAVQGARNGSSDAAGRACHEHGLAGKRSRRRLARHRRPL